MLAEPVNVSTEISGRRRPGYDRTATHVLTLQTLPNNGRANVAFSCLLESMDAGDGADGRQHHGCGRGMDGCTTSPGQHHHAAW